MCNKNRPKVKTLNLDLLKIEMKLFFGAHAKPFLCYSYEIGVVCLYLFVFVFNRSFDRIMLIFLLISNSLLEVF